MTGRNRRTSRTRRLLVVAALAAATIAPAAVHAAPDADAPGRTEDAPVASTVPTPVLALMGLSWL